MGLAINGNRAAIGRVGTGDGFDQRGFARAVFAHNGVDLTGIKINGDIVQRYHAGVVLHDVFQRKNGCFAFQMDAPLFGI